MSAGAGNGDGSGDSPQVAPLPSAPASVGARAPTSSRDPSTALATGTATSLLAPRPLAQPFAKQLIHAGTGLPFSDKGRKTAGLLQILLCGLGAGRFYLGYPKVALLQILVTWCTCGAGVLWPVIDGIRMLEGRIPDAKGRPLRED